MIFNGKEYKSITVTDKNGAVVAVIADKDSILYSGAKIMFNAEFSNTNNMMYAHSDDVME